MFSWFLSVCFLSPGGVLGGPYRAACLPRPALVVPLRPVSFGLCAFCVVFCLWCRGFLLAFCFCLFLGCCSALLLVCGVASAWLALSLLRSPPALPASSVSPLPSGRCSAGPSLWVSGFGLVVVVCFWFAWFLLFLVVFFALFSCWDSSLDCVQVHYQYFCGYRQVDSLA